MAGIPVVYTIARVVEMLREDEAWLRGISTSMDPEEGHLWVIGVGDDAMPALTEYGIECLKQIVVEDVPYTSESPMQVRDACGTHRRLTTGRGCSVEDNPFRGHGDLQIAN